MSVPHEKARHKGRASGSIASMIATSSESNTHLWVAGKTIITANPYLFPPQISHSLFAWLLSKWPSHPTRFEIPIVIIIQ
jgi:hypothetical protein